MTLLFMCLIALSGCKETVQNAPDRYNYQRALEALENNKMEEAINFCEKDLEENPKDARTLAILAAAYHLLEQNGKALEILDETVKLWSGKAGENVVNPYFLRATVLLEMEDTVKALEDLERALLATDIRKNIRAEQLEIYYAKGDNEKVKEIGEKTIQESPNYTTVYYYLGLVALNERKWNEAFAFSDKIEKLGKEDLASAQFLRARASMESGDYEEAANDIIELLATEDWNNSGFALMTAMADSTNHFEAMKTRLEIQAEKEPNESYWLYCLGVIYEAKRMYAAAIDYYKKSAELDADVVTYERIAQCYSSVGDFRNALRYADEALLIDSTALNIMRIKTELLMAEGRTKESLKCADEWLALDSESSIVHETRGDLYQYAGKLDEAIKEYGKSLALVPDNSYVHIQRGKLLKQKGLESKANADFKKVLKVDSLPDAQSYAHFAYYYLNEYGKAKKCMARILKKDSTAGTYYDAACLYSLMNDSVISLKYFKTALEKGYRDFRHVALDSDLDNIRQLDTFKTLMNKYMQKGNEKGFAEENDGERVFVTSEVPFTKEGGVCKVKCKINGLPLHFIFDTGASDVTLSMVEATFMMKNGYLSNKDVIGSQQYMDANGNVSVGTVINLKNVDFGELKLSNIRASVVRNQKAPLLLGQSVLGRLGKIEIDNSKRVLKISHSK